ncbi:unnamed protein product, partial [Rotaria socialis]
LGGNSYLENIVQSLVEIFHNDSDSGNEQDMENNDKYPANQNDQTNRSYKKPVTYTESRYKI